MKITRILGHNFTFELGNLIWHVFKRSNGSLVGTVRRGDYEPHADHIKVTAPDGSEVCIPWATA